jgi:hypothetical protein
MKDSVVLRRPDAADDKPENEPRHLGRTLPKLMPL